ncbi:hypothetical protein VTO42DRAFT_4336 [Malbranchea cinnamomea]
MTDPPRTPRTPRTPRLPASFPQTPRTILRTPRTQNGALPQPRPAPPVPPVKGVVALSQSRQQDAGGPLISFDVIDAPSQRLYVLAFYAALHAWRIYESWSTSDDIDATWLFLKWVAIDGVFLFGLPALRIPWLEWAFPTTLAVFLVHGVFNAFLMFRIPIPIGSWLAALVKVAYDRELSILERSVKPADILYNSSLILGKQIVNILPEGSAVLNPDQKPFCLDSQRLEAKLPIRINQTTPIIIEILRVDLETGQNETIIIPPKQARQLKKEADKHLPKSDTSSPRDLLYPVKKTGIYQLLKVIDESKLQVQRRSLDTLVVTCPRAAIRPSSNNRCKNELSNLVLEVEGTPPLKIKYSRSVNSVDQGVSFQNIQPENFRSPLAGQGALRSFLDPSNPDVYWAQAHKISVPLNESLNTAGEWVYTIEEVHDACGNVANYSTPADPIRTQQLFVHERPRIALTGCNSQKYLQAAKGDSIDLPVQFRQYDRRQAADAPYTLVYTHSPRAADGGPQDSPSQPHKAVLASVDHKPKIKEPGWYSINSISSQFCSGEVLEPSSCYLHNPPEPQLSLRHEKLYDKCANNSVGLMVYLDLIGTPPFRIRYSIEHGRGVQTRVQTVDGLRAQIDLTPSEAGHYRYQFLDIADSVYESRSLKNKVPVLEQDVKPPASAQFAGRVTSRKACFGEPISADISFVGEAPWVLQYELVHNGKRNKFEITSDQELLTLTTQPLFDGGEYVLGLTSVRDRSNCRRPLKEEIAIEVRPKRPRVSFGQIERKRDVLSLEDKKVELPVRLEGEAPWSVKYRNVQKPLAPTIEATLWNENSVLQVGEEGQYELLAVHDATCPGSVDDKAKTFTVSWIPRPKIAAADGVSLEDTNTVVKGEVCEGDEDVLELKFSGTPPYTVKYEQQRKPTSGSPSINMKNVGAAMNSASIQMDTSKPGDYSYKFLEIGDNLYRSGGKRQPALIVTQKVNPRPSARFEYPNRIYGFCKEEGDSDETIPIILEGVPPFALEIGVRHHTSAKPEILSVPNINSRHYNLPVPRRYFDLGQHVVNIRKVRDARGCERTTEYDGSSVRVTVSDVPTIIPLESQVDYCVGDRLSFSLSGHAPFEVYYTFNGVHRKATSQTTNFRRIAEVPGEFTITAVSDGASGRCKAHKNITKIIHPMPSVRISQGAVSVVDIHEGGEAEMLLEFGGTPPFEFTYTRSSNARRGAKSQVLDTKHDISYEYSKTVKASDEGTYEVVAIKDKYCSFSKQNPPTTGSRRSS